MSKQGRPPIRALTIFLAKAGIMADELLDPSKPVTETAVRDVGTLYSRRSVLRAPTWASFFEDAIDADQLHLRTSSASAVLVVPVEQRFFVLTFGYGRSLVNRAAVEESFGLKVTLNAVTDGRIRSIDRRSFEGITTHIREQASKEGSFGDFGLNVERDLLRAVVGGPTDPANGIRLAGMDALSAACRVDLQGLPALLARYLQLASDPSYKERYPWIDNIAEVRDPSLIVTLNDHVSDDLRNRRLDRKWLSVPDLMEWHDVGGFRYSDSNKGPLVADIHLSTYLNQLRDADAVTVDTLRRHRVRVFSASSEQEVARWSTFKCLYAEVEYEGATYLLNNGEWYRIDQNFERRINEAIGSVPRSAITTIAYASNEAEARYNERLAESLDACLMDQKNISFGGGRSKVEFCDVLTAERQMVHVKRYRGSAVLSHLFAQGAVSAMALASDAEFRKKLNGKLCATHKLPDPLQRLNASDWEVAYVVASDSANDLKLPFFSRVTLRNAAQHLVALGFRVTLTKIGVEDNAV